MKPLSCIQSLVIVLIILCASVGEAKAIKDKKVKPQIVTCYNRYSKCFLKKVKCPAECPTTKPAKHAKPNAKCCFLDCNSKKCEAVCRKPHPDCNRKGAACQDPRFVGGDGVIFYFHGKSSEHFSLVSDSSLQINARFIGHRPAGRPRDYTWIQALGLVLGSHNFSVEATKAQKWDSKVDHLQFSYDGKTLNLPEIHSWEWISPDNGLKIERTACQNSVTVTAPGIIEILVGAVPVTEEDNRIHNYQIPSGDCFAHLEIQFRFTRGFSSRVEGVLGRTYRPDFKNPAKVGVAMPVVGGEDKYRVSSLFSADCVSCMFSPEKAVAEESSVPLAIGYGPVDCTTGAARHGSRYGGLVCRK
ncbi:uncharacterized protein LOC127808161 [Diospyros lotus]|uniref:uncharacterized protein LOC127808161 n=1 Tax=Diospyros lotus TaxID=55363 RepID=UPI00225ABC01|nr:uncharacterized protein LOC127808161 [Diospyros lotus]